MQYPVCYLDPPWPYEVYNADTGHGRSAESHYGTMTWADLATFGRDYLNPALTPGAFVFCWVVPPSLDQALDMIRRDWGLEYITKAFCWVKLSLKGNGFYMGMGHYTRANSEDCLLFWKPAKGVKSPRQDRGVKQIIVTEDGDDELPYTVLASVMRHSQKPNEVAHKIQRLMPGPYLEVFARRRRDSPLWTFVGNEVNQGRDANSVLRDITLGTADQSAANDVTLGLLPTLV
jgi:N6-adenosine-specific RNA methylase IME4